MLWIVPPVSRFSGVHLFLTGALEIPKGFSERELDLGLLADGVGGRVLVLWSMVVRMLSFEPLEGCCFSSDWGVTGSLGFGLLNVDFCSVRGVLGVFGFGVSGSCGFCSDWGVPGTFGFGGRFFSDSKGDAFFGVDTELFSLPSLRTREPLVRFAVPMPRPFFASLRFED